MIESYLSDFAERRSDSEIYPRIHPEAVELADRVGTDRYWLIVCTKMRPPSAREIATMPSRLANAARMQRREYEQSITKVTEMFERNGISRGPARYFAEYTAGLRSANRHDALKAGITSVSSYYITLRKTHKIIVTEWLNIIKSLSENGYHNRSQKEEKNNE